MGELTQEQQDKLSAVIAFIGHTGAESVNLRYQDDEQPVIWMMIASYPNGKHEVDASLDPVRAALRLCERLADGGQCQHCGRPSGLDPDTYDTMPLNNVICWYQYDPETKRFRRSCE